MTTGCRTTALPTNSGRQQNAISINRQDAAMAEALANYGMGVLREGQQNAGAVSNYLRAIELEPGLTPLYLRAAGQHIKQGDKNKAIAIMEEACRTNPRAIDAAVLLSQFYQIINQPEGARKAARRAIEIAPEDYQGYIQLASLYIAEKNKKEAELVLRAALNKVKDQLPILRILGDLHAQQIVGTDTSSPDFKEAVFFYEKAIAFPADDSSLIYLERIGDLYLADEQADKALTCFLKIAIYDADNIQIQQKLALCYIAAGNKEKALESLRKIAGHEPQSPALYYYLGELYDSLGDQEHAMENLKAARDAEPLNPKSYLKMAIIHLRNNPQKAKETLQDGLKRLPKERLFLEILVQIYLNNRQFSEALALFEQMRFNLSPGDSILHDPRFYIHYGIAAQQCRLVERAIALYSKALEIDPDSFEARVRLAALYIWMKNPEEAFELMEDAISANPDDTAAWFFYAIISSRAGEYKQAAAAFRIAEKSAAKLPDNGAQALDSSFYFNYGGACERSGDLEAAEKLLTKAIMLNPENSDAFNYLAYMWADKGINFDQALNYIQHALDFEPDNGADLDTLGWILFKQKKYEKALEYIQNARVLMPEDPVILEHLGDVLAGLGRENQALEAWQQSFQRDISNTSLEEKLRKHGIDTEQLRRNSKPNENPPPDLDE
ncbi:MAG: tetratricopeptide repeat protein [Kiritimatiellia bacterium]|nr:tetratricopeptide repeat protein [Kiritimatiellia bacterium]